MLKKTTTSNTDERKTKSELLFELRMQRLENVRLKERLADSSSDLCERRQLKYLENIALIDKVIRQTTDLDVMMDNLMDVIRAIFKCDQAWLLHPCDPDSPNWKVPYRSVSPMHPIPFEADETLPATPDLAENCRLALETSEPIPLGSESTVKNVPKEARKASARSALLTAIHPKVGRPWLMGLHQCATDRTWSAEEKLMFQDISSRIADALSATLFYRDLEENQERLKHLSAQLFRAHEEERKRVAEEIHDELGQASLAVKVGIDNVLFMLGEDAPTAISRALVSASNMTQDMVRKIRRMQSSLYPSTLRDFGAITALQGLLDDFDNIYSTFTVARSFYMKDEDIPDMLRVTVFRLAQEALYNAAKHSKADSITVILDRLGSRLILEVMDNGIGFNPNTTIRYPAKRLGLGLTSMRERAEMTDGKLDIISSPGRGTTIRVVWRIPDSTE